jgi:hypothetical protein
MIVYQTDPDGYYVCPVEADESPLEPGKFLIPAGAIEEEPPEAGPGEIQLWNGYRWELVLKPSNGNGGNVGNSEEIITFRQFILEAYSRGWFTEQEAEDLAARNSIPAILRNVINKALSGREVVKARVTILTMTELHRHDSLLEMLLERLDIDDEQADKFFREAARL